MSGRQVSADKVRAAVREFQNLGAPRVVLNARDEEPAQWLEPVRRHLHRTGLIASYGVQVSGRDVYLYRKP